MVFVVCLNYVKINGYIQNIYSWNNNNVNYSISKYTSLFSIFVSRIHI